jgi:general stress protein CsbA
VRVSVWFATLLLFSSLGGFHCDLKPRFGTTFLFALVLFITFANITFMAFSVIAQAVVSVVATGFALDVAFLASGFAFALDVADLTAGFFANLNLTRTVLRAVR